MIPVEHDPDFVELWKKAPVPPADPLLSTTQIVLMVIAIVAGFVGHWFMGFLLKDNYAP